ncbi:hypothetical protein [Terrabacter sp. MAHUQ-38]|uniref:hypothetical protein n=1 Tax=unclassified Terrabacter TaxID=2630222 RepID=UPI00165EB89E|nr:hypothetical protein [Terrabacter sp. MAHUQ-38]MBC9819702.1 hypothetical protein [Terrabacter sp. MAHUQ-38]
MNERQVSRHIMGTSAEALLLAADEAGGQLLPSAFEAAVGDEREGHAAAAALRELSLAEGEPSAVAEVTLTYIGKKVAAVSRKSRTNGLARMEAVQRGLLEWLEDAGHPADVSVYLRDERATAFGVPFTKTEVDQATAYLVEQGLMKVLGSNASWALRPELTPRGRNALHSDGTVQDYAEGSGGDTTVNDQRYSWSVSGGTVTGVQQGGSHNTQHVALHLTHDERTQVLQVVDKALSGLPAADDVRPLRQALESIRDDAETGAAPKPRLLERARDALVMATATEGGRSVIEWLGQLVTSLSG